MTEETVIHISNSHGWVAGRAWPYNEGWKWATPDGSEGIVKTLEEAEKEILSVDKRKET